MGKLSGFEAMAMFMSAHGFYVKEEKFASNPVWKPRFSEEELAELRALPKRERNKRVEELRQKYMATKVVK